MTFVCTSCGVVLERLDALCGCTEMALVPFPSGWTEAPEGLLRDLYRDAPPGRMRQDITAELNRRARRVALRPQLPNTPSEKMRASCLRERHKAKETLW